MANKNKVMKLAQEEGYEMATIFVLIPTSPPLTFTAHTWGILESHPFFDTPDGRHIELHGGAAYMIQTPAKGYTIDAEGRHRELRKEESAIIQ